MIISALIAGAAPSSIVFILSRVAAGLAVGAASVLAPVYISEVTPAAIRGRLATLQQIMIISGLTGAFLVNYWLASTAGHSTAIFWMGYPAWRWMFWAQVIPAGIYLLTLFLIPDSPRFLVMRGKYAEAEDVLGRILGRGVAKQKTDEIRASLAQDQHRPRLSDLLDKNTGKVRKIVWAGIGLAVAELRTMPSSDWMRVSRCPSGRARTGCVLCARLGGSCPGHGQNLVRPARGTSAASVSERLGKT